MTTSGQYGVTAQEGGGPPEDYVPLIRAYELESIQSCQKYSDTRKPALRVFLAPPEGLMTSLSSLYHA